MKWLLAIGTRKGLSLATSIPVKADAMRMPGEGPLRMWGTTDAGETGQPSQSGQPDDIWSVVLRDAACVDTAQTTLVYLGTRDGSVYASADAGHTCTTVAEHLPDGLSVRVTALA